MDLGTEFALNVSANRSEVHVLDGEVEWHPRAEAMRRMEKGEALRWNADGKGTALAANAAGFVGITDMREKLTRGAPGAPRGLAAIQRDPAARSAAGRLLPDGTARKAAIGALPNRTSAGTASEGAIVAAARVRGSLGHAGGALDFSPTGSRVRVNVPGEYRSLTLLTLGEDQQPRPLV